MSRARWLPGLVLLVLSAGCDGHPPTVPPPSPTQAPSVVASPTLPSPASTAPPTASPATPPAAPDIRATHLVIPAVGIDAEVQGSQVVPDTSSVPAGCPPTPPGQETLTVPNEGIATPEDSFEGLEHTAWIFGHSRWRNQPGLFFVLEDLNVGDELYIEGFDRVSGKEVARQRYVVQGIYLTDRDSGSTLINADGADAIPQQSLVILQTSVRETGVDRQWLLDRAKVLAKATNLVEGDLDDPCKYLLLFVVARAA